MTVLDDALLASLDDSVADVAKASTLPAVLYTSPEVLRFELDAVFAHEWLCVGRSERIPNPGDWFTTTFGDEPIIVARDKTRQRQRPVGGVPAPGDAGLRRSRQLDDVEVPVPPLDLRPRRPPARRPGDGAHGGVREVGVGPAAAAGRGVAGLRVRQPRSPRRRRSRRRWSATSRTSPTTTSPTPSVPARSPLTGLPWNWKVMFENFNDGYHANRLHQFVQDFCPSSMTAFPVPWDDASNVIFRTAGYTHRDGGFNATHQAIMPVFPKLTEEERWRSTFALVPADAVLRHRARPVLLLPRAPHRAARRSTSRSATSSTRRRSTIRCSSTSCKLSDVGVQVFVQQDQDATTKVQRGLRSRFAPRGRYSWQEESHVQFNRWLVQRYRRHWPAIAGGVVRSGGDGLTISPDSAEGETA